jgi:hypothetical protein
LISGLPILRPFAHIIRRRPTDALGRCTFQARVAPPWTHCEKSTGPTQLQVLYKFLNGPDEGRETAEFFLRLFITCADHVVYVDENDGSVLVEEILNLYAAFPM